MSGVHVNYTYCIINIMFDFIVYILSHFDLSRFTISRTSLNVGS